MNTHSKPKLDPLTSLRFFAASMIVVYHAGGRGLGPDWPLRFALGQGVSFFFVLSGFVLAYNHPVLADKKAVINFYISRIARIWPAHIASAAIYIALIGNISYYALPEQTRGLITLAHVTMTQAWIPISSFITAYNTVSWSISTEFFFYLAFPLLIANWRKTWRNKLVLTFFLTCVMWVLATKFAIAPNGTEDGRGNLGYINPLARLFEFTLGIGLCNLYQIIGPGFSQRLTRHRATMVEALTLLAVLISLWSSHEIAGNAFVAATLSKTSSIVFATSGFGTFVFAWTILVFAIGKGSISGFLKTRPMVFLGEISFGLYLVHTLFLLYRQQAPGVFESFSNIEIYIMYWATSLGLAILLHFYVERPGQSLIKGWYEGGNHRTRIVPNLRALAIFVTAIFFIVFLQPSARLPYPAVQANNNNSVKNLVNAPVSFSPGYRLDKVAILRPTDDSHVWISFAWTAGSNVSLNKRVAIHLLDALGGKMIGQLDFSMETGYRRAKLGEQWSNLVRAEHINLSNVKVMGVAVYDASGMSNITPSDVIQTDWNGTRLLIGMVDGDSPIEKISKMGSYTSNIKSSDIVGDWKAGQGVAKIVAPSEGMLLLTTETGFNGHGTILGDRIEVPSWHVTGRLAEDRYCIKWSNGALWTRNNPSKKL